MVKTLILLTSSACNLNCSFCYLHKDKILTEYDKEILQAWKEKTYISTVLNSILKFDANPYDIKEVQFWGGETLLHINELKENIQELYTYFPNIQKYLIPTNWTIHIKEFFEFIKELDKYALPNTDFAVQLSIDGPKGYSESGHNVSFETYKKNIKLFADLVNNYKLKNVKLRFSINATISKELYLNKLFDYNEIKNYVQQMTELTSYINECFVSESCAINTNHVFPGLSLPATETVEEGLKLTSINRLWEYVYMNEFKNNTWNNLHDKYFYFGIQNFNLKEDINSKDPYCGQLKVGLTFLPDGTIVECSSAYIDPNEKYQQECLELNDKDRYLASKLHASLSINPLTASEYDLKKFKWSVINGIRDTEKTSKYFHYNICKELAKSGQISQKYLYDKELLIKHLEIIAGPSTCMYENINTTKNPLISNPSNFRRYLNGLAEYVYDNQKIEILKAEIKY